MVAENSLSFVHDDIDSVDRNLMYVGILVLGELFNRFVFR